MTYVPFSTHTHYSLLRGFLKPSQLKLDCPAIAITDYDSLSGVVNFSKSVSKNGIKPILGTKLYISDHDGYLTLIARNLDGWKELIGLHNKAHKLLTPAINIDDIASTKDIFIISGDIDSTLYNGLLNHKEAVAIPNIHNSLDYYLLNPEEIISERIEQYKSLFGDRFWIGIQRTSQKSCPVDEYIANILSEYAEKYDVPKIGLPFIHYANKSDAALHRLLLCSHYKTTLSAISHQLAKSDYCHLYRFFNDDSMRCLTTDEMRYLYDEDEIANSVELAGYCENYSILNKPQLPNFPCPNNMSASEYLKELCRIGWKNNKSRFAQPKYNEYVERIKTELDVLTRVGIEGYFLIVQDYVNWAKNQGILTSPGRGSAAGSLVSYLTGITSIDPIQYELFFERFYNEGRNTADKVSLPDIDVDFPPEFRDKVIDYIRDKYNKEHVSQVFTLSEIQGASAIREVLRVNQACSASEINTISKSLPKRDKISDKLEESGEKSIIRWTLENEPNRLQDWCKLDKNELVGPLADQFKLAIEIEGTFKSYGKHASAVVVTNQPIQNICPMVQDKKTGVPLAAIEYAELEEMGLPKFDILGVQVLSKIMHAVEIVRTGKMSPIGECHIDEEENEENED